MTSSIRDRIGGLRAKGIQLWSEGGSVHYRARKGTLTESDLDLLRKSKLEVLAVLEQDRMSLDPDWGTVRNRRLVEAPLSFSQLAYWQMCRSGEQPHIRNVASATRLKGRLNIDALSGSLSETLRRQDALRTRIVSLDDIPHQQVLESANVELAMDNLNTIPEAALEEEIQRRIGDLIFQPIDPSIDPLFAARLLKVTEIEHVLILAMEHLIADARSLGILLNDILISYAGRVAGRNCERAPPTVQFATYAAWQRRMQAPILANRSARWDEHLAGCDRLRLPNLEGDTESGDRGWAVVSFYIDPQLLSGLLEWSRIRRTTPALAVLTAYAGLLLRWCSVPEAVIRFQTDGRSRQELNDTIGYFASPLFLRVRLLERDTFDDLLRRMTAELCSAREADDLSLREAGERRASFTRNGCFNWRPRPPELEMPDRPGLLSHQDVPIQFDLLESLNRDTEPEVGFIEAEDQIHVHVQYPRHRFSMRTMERFGRNLLFFLREQLSCSCQRVGEISLI